MELELLFTYWYLLPTAITISFLAMSSGISGSNFWIPVYTIIVGVDSRIGFWLALFTMLFGFGSGCLKYIKEKGINWKVAGSYLKIAVPASTIGGLLSNYIEMNLLILLFALLIFLYGSFMLLDKYIDIGKAEVKKSTPNASLVFVAGFLKGIVSTGLGKLIVPDLQANRKIKSNKEAVGTAIFIVFIGNLFALVSRLNASFLHDLNSNKETLFSILLWVVPGVITGGMFGPKIVGKLNKVQMRKYVGFLLVLCSFFISLRVFGVENNFDSEKIKLLAGLISIGAISFILGRAFTLQGQDRLLSLIAVQMMNDSQRNKDGVNTYIEKHLGAANKDRYKFLNKLLNTYTRSKEDEVRESVSEVSKDLLQSGITLNLMSDKIYTSSKNLEKKSQEGEKLTTDVTNISVEVSSSLKKCQEDINNVKRDTELVKGKSNLSAELSKKMSVVNESLKNQSEELMDISEKIKDVSFNSKLLSFNASVEAVRVGEAGKGFAVVAEEIGALANSSAKYSQSTDKILQTTIENINKNDESSSKFYEYTKEIDTALKQTDSSIENYLHSFSKQKVFVNGMLGKLDSLKELITNTKTTAKTYTQYSEDIKDQVGFLKESLVRIQELIPVEMQDQSTLAQIKALGGSAKPEDVFYYNLTVNIPRISQDLKDKHLSGFVSTSSAVNKSIKPKDVFKGMVELYNLLATKWGWENIELYDNKDIGPSDVLMMSLGLTDMINRNTEECRMTKEKFNKKYEEYNEKVKRDIIPGDVYNLINYTISSLSPQS